MFSEKEIIWQTSLGKHTFVEHVFIGNQSVLYLRVSQALSGRFRYTPHGTVNSCLCREHHRSTKNNNVRWRNFKNTLFCSFHDHHLSKTTALSNTCRFVIFLEKRFSKIWDFSELRHSFSTHSSGKNAGSDSSTALQISRKTDKKQKS